MKDEVKIFYAILIAALIFIIIAAANFAITANRHRQDEKFQNMQHATYLMSFSYEKLLKDNDKYNNNTSLIQNDAKDVRLALYQHILAMSDLGKSISKDTFCSLLGFNKLIDSTIMADDKIDASKLIPIDDNTKVKHDLVFNLYDDQAYYHTFFGGISTLLGDDSIAKYKRTDCK